MEKLEEMGFDKIYQSPTNADILICVKSEEDHILREHYSVPEDKFLGKTEWWASCGEMGWTPYIE